MGIERERKVLARKEMSKPETELAEINLAAVMSSVIPKGMTRAYRNNRYTVMIFDNHPTSHGPAIRAMVQKLDNTPITFHWREMQRIKNIIFGTETVAVEYYPAESKLHNTHNIYWMWIFPEGVLPIPKF